MNTYYIAYPVIPGMGLRGELNAMLKHVAYNRHDFGYLPSVVHQANHERLLEDFGAIVEDNRGVLVLVPRVRDSALLEDLADTLETLCNDYPAYDDERVHDIEHGRLIDMLEDARGKDDPHAEDIAYALYEHGVCIEQSEYGANISEDDYSTAVEYARREDARKLEEVTRARRLARLVN